ncbi:MAG: hypothetical protein NC078_12465 [Ruminococcus sp.]|nr:hypothetical protein [Ruminococcus sp.]
MRYRIKPYEYICAACGAKMYLSEDGLVLMCSNEKCNYGVNVEDYGTVYDTARGELDSALGDYADEDDGDIPPCCAACGGPYPDCMTSCSIFDD